MRLPLIKCFRIGWALLGANNCLVQKILKSILFAFGWRIALNGKYWLVRNRPCKNARIELMAGKEILS